MTSTPHTTAATVLDRPRGTFLVENIATYASGAHVGIRCDHCIRKATQALTGSQGTRFMCGDCLNVDELGTW